MTLARLLPAAMAGLLFGCSPGGGASDSTALASTEARDMGAALIADGANWPSGGRDYSEQNFSPLEQISAATIGKLGLAWSLDLDGEHSLEATPLAIDGVLYFFRPAVQGLRGRRSLR